MGRVPRTVGFNPTPLIFLLLVGGSRAVARFWLAGWSGKARRKERLLIYGAGEAGVQTASARCGSVCAVRLCR
jgi:FlaA1/EpsC-like NDP-sugar epimerase